MEIFIKMFEEMGRRIGCDFEVMAEVHPWVLVGSAIAIVLVVAGVWCTTRNN